MRSYGKYFFRSKAPEPLRDEKDVVRCFPHEASEQFRDIRMWSRLRGRLPRHGWMKGKTATTPFHPWRAIHPSARPITSTRLRFKTTTTSPILRHGRLPRRLGGATTTTSPHPSWRAIHPSACRDSRLNVVRLAQVPQLEFVELLTAKG
jgi:hypothetical protein